MKIMKFNQVNNISESKLFDELKKSGYNDNEISSMMQLSKDSKLGMYMLEHGSDFTFGILNAIYLDIESHKLKTDIFKNVFKSMYRIIPGVVAWMIPLFGVVGMTLSFVRGTNRVITPIVDNPGNNYPEFLKKFLTIIGNVSDGELPMDDPLRRAFLLNDNITKIIKPDLIHKFIYHLSNKMSMEESSKLVPDNYIEDEFRIWILENYKITIL